MHAEGRHSIVIPEDATQSPEPPGITPLSSVTRVKGRYTIYCGYWSQADTRLSEIDGLVKN